MSKKIIMKSKRGFTMLEMAIVLIMIGILTASLTPLLLRQFTNSKEDQDRQALLAAKTAIISYATSFGGIPNPGNPAVIGTVSGVMPSVAAFGVNNWGAFGSTNPFQMDVNDSLTSSVITASSVGAASTVGGDKVVFCQAVNAQMITAAPNSPKICQDFNDHTSACTSVSPVAFVLYSTGNDRTANQENALNLRIYENDTRGINNSNDIAADHYDDQVMSYPLSALVRDCRERMNVLPEVMACTPGYKYVGSVFNNVDTSVASSVGYTLTGVVTASSVPANNTVYINQCVTRTAMMAVGTQSGVPISTNDTNADGRVDFVITGTNSFTAQ